MKLFFEDGTSFTGESFGAKRNVCGEVVFNTGMSGYVETLTDPSYCSQIVVLTYPLQGNYGVPKGPYESDKIQVLGVIVSHYSPNPSHYTSTMSLGDWLSSQNIPAMFNVDTRSLTRYLRQFGTTTGTMLNEDAPDKNIETIDYTNCLRYVVPTKPTCYVKGKERILLVDAGVKENIVRSFLNRDVTVVRAPWNSDWEEFLPEVDGLFFANGPGDPMDALDLIGRIRKVISSSDLPIFGICLGNQLLALAAGAKTVKMKYGNRSVNQPVRDLITGKCYITSQNHGYVVQTESLSHDWEPWFINLNDGSNEGIRHKTKPIYSVQFHPEACPGPNDTVFLFDKFIEDVKKHKKGNKPSNLIDKVERAEAA